MAAAHGEETRRGLPGIPPSECFVSPGWGQPPGRGQPVRVGSLGISPGAGQPGQPGSTWRNPQSAAFATASSWDRTSSFSRILRTCVRTVA